MMLCDQVTDFLVSNLRSVGAAGGLGASAGGQTREVSEHIGSCLLCFRTAADLRDAPRLEKILRDAQPSGNDATDPGLAFWNGFPSATALAWQNTVKAAKGSERAVSATAARTPFTKQVREWLRLPLPSALAGASVAAAVMLVMAARPGPQKTAESPIVSVPPAMATASGDRGLAPVLDEGLEPSALERLETADLHSLLSSLEAETRPPLPSVDDVVEPSVSAAEAVEALESDDLNALAQALRRAGQI